MQDLTSTGQWFTSSEGTRWWFDSGSVALDLAYTGGFGERWESVSTVVELGGWLHERFGGVTTEVSEGDLADAKALRASVARVAVGVSRGEVPSPEDVDVLNLFAATPDIPPSLTGGSRRAGRSTARPGQAMAAIAREAVGLFGPENRARIRECGAADCQLVFYDDSRSNNRRWCSMQRCGNRAKVRAHRGRTA